MAGAPAADLGLTGAQLENARTIIAEGKRRGATPTQIDIALMVALDESSLLNRANTTIPDTLAIPHQDVGSDHASVGVFQQQVGIWGTAPDLMNVPTSAGLFFDALKKVPVDAAAPWKTAQAVQKSADPTGSNYRAHWAAAQQIRAGLDTGSSAQPAGWLDSAAGVAGGAAALAKTMAAAQAIGHAFTDPDFWKRIGLGALGAVLLLIAGWMMFAESDAAAALVSTAKKVIL
jgi:hypothetical protein